MGAAMGQGQDGNLEDDFSDYVYTTNGTRIYDPVTAQRFRDAEAEARDYVENRPSFHESVYDVHSPIRPIYLRGLLGEKGGIIPYVGHGRFILTREECLGIINGLLRYYANTTDEYIKDFNLESEVDRRTRSVSETAKAVKKIRTEDFKREGFIYLIKSEYGYKIGMTKSVKDRMVTFAVGLPFKWDLVYYEAVGDMHTAERWLHHRYQRFRLNGEWFNLPLETVWAIQEQGFSLPSFDDESTREGEE